MNTLQEQFDEAVRILRSCYLNERYFFKVTDRLGDSIAVNYGSKLVPIPMEEMLDVSEARARLVGSIGLAEEFLNKVPGGKLGELPPDI